MVVIVVIHYDNVCYVANPQLIGCGWDVFLDKIWIYWKTMCRVRSARLGYSQSHLLTVLVGYPAEAVTTYRMITQELLTVHLPYLRDAHAWIQLVYILDILESELLSGCFSQEGIVIVLIISLRAYANQFAKRPDEVSATIPCVQVIYCLAPAFFLIGILNFASATLIISS